MGKHSFAELPDQARLIGSAYPEIVNEGVFGVAQNWDLPVAMWRAREGFDVHYPSNAHLTLSFVRGGAQVERLDGRFAGQHGYADQDSFMLYADGGSRRYASRGDVRLCQMYLQSSLIRDIALVQDGRSADGTELRDDRIFAHDLELRRMMDRYVSRAEDAVDPPSRLEMDARAVLLGVHLLRYHSNRTRLASVPKPDLGAHSMASVIDYIEDHLAEDLSLAQLSDVSHLSPRHFTDAFRRSIGTTPHRFVTDRRIARAKCLLEGSMPLAVIALECGFGSQQHFTAVFRQIAGTTPGIMRASLRH